VQAQRGLQRGPRREFEERAALGFGRWRAGTGELGSEQAHGRRGVCCRRAGAWPGYVGCVLCVWVLVGDAWNLEGREGRGRERTALGEMVLDCVARRCVLEIPFDG
jgi:hypothetical protein